MPIEEEPLKENELGELTPFQRASKHLLFLRDISEKQTGEQIIQELLQYLNQNYVEVGGVPALALVDLIALEYAEIQRFDPANYNIMLDAINLSLNNCFQQLEYSIREASQEDIGYFMETISILLEKNFHDLPLELSKISQENIKERTNYVYTNLAQFFNEVQYRIRTHAVFPKVGSKYRKPLNIDYSKIKSMIESFLLKLEDHTTYAAIQRDIERTKFMIVGYWEAYQNIKTWFDMLAETTYRDEIKFNENYNEERASAYSKLIAIDILKSLSEDILDGKFAAPSQFVAEEDQKTTVEIETEETLPARKNTG